MTLLDAYALVAFLAGGPAQVRVRELLREGDAAVATANLAESLDVSQRIHALPMLRTTEVLDTLFEEVVAVVPLDRATAVRAATIRANHYHRSNCPISLADAVLLASAGSSDRVATADPSVLAVAELLGVTTVPLPQQG